MSPDRGRPGEAEAPAANAPVSAASSPAPPPSNAPLPLSASSVTVKLARFEGPLDLLLHLIKRDEIDIYDIPIARITQQYLAYIELMRSLDLEVAGEFLVMAATLMRIKAKMLLPLPGIGEEDEEGDPREELVQRLIEYRQFKEAAGTLKFKEGERRLLFERGMVPGEDEAGPLPLAPVTLFDLLDALNRVMSRVPAETVYEVEGDLYDVEDKMAWIASTVADRGSLSFSELLLRCRARAEMIVTFIALLELIKLGQVAVLQDQNFGDIVLVARMPEGSETHASDESARGD
ncbi:MAG: segregation/condensation protein A [Candidatus Eisenbacteria bacterium]|nr:segregation/condensation protein A [Candidatus Eisenbacteria bacterium]